MGLYRKSGNPRRQEAALAPASLFSFHYIAGKVDSAGHHGQDDSVLSGGIFDTTRRFHRDRLRLVSIVRHSGESRGLPPRPFYSIHARGGPGAGLRGWGGHFLWNSPTGGISPCESCTPRGPGSLGG